MQQVSQANPRLESLPAELRIMILFSLADLESVRSIIYASPVYYQTYRPIKYTLLSHLLDVEYDGVESMADALTAVRSKGLYASIPSNKEKIIALLDSRRRGAEPRNLGSWSANSPVNKPASREETAQVLQLYKDAHFCLEDFCSNVSGPEWMDPGKWEAEILPLRPSKIEKTRFFRAVYRLQICANIFGRVECTVEGRWLEWDEDNDWRDKTFSREEAWRLLFGPMAPWEIEEIGCVWHHL